MRVEAPKSRRVIACAWHALPTLRFTPFFHFPYRFSGIERLVICYPLQDKRQPYVIYSDIALRIKRSSRFLQEILWLELEDIVTRRQYFIILTRWQCSDRTYRRLTKIIKQSNHDR